MHIYDLTFIIFLQYTQKVDSGFPWVMQMNVYVFSSVQLLSHVQLFATP